MLRLNISLIIEPYGEYYVIFHDVIIMFARDLISATNRDRLGLPTKKIERNLSSGLCVITVYSFLA